MQQNEHTGNTYACHHHSSVHTWLTVLIKSIRTLFKPDQQFSLLQIYSTVIRSRKIRWNKQNTKQECTVVVSISCIVNSQVLTAQKKSVTIVGSVQTVSNHMMQIKWMSNADVNNEQCHVAYLRSWVWNTPTTYLQRRIVTIIITVSRHDWPVLCTDTKTCTSQFLHLLHPPNSQYIQETMCLAK